MMFRGLEACIPFGESSDIFLGNNERAITIAEPPQQVPGRFGKRGLRALKILALTLS